MIVKAINIKEEKTYNGIFHLLLSEHVIERLDHRARSIAGINGIIKAFLTDEFIGYGVWENEELVGFVWGHLIGDCWEAHTAFNRHVDTLSAARLIEDRGPIDYGIKKVIAYSPLSNRAARVFHHRMGYKRNGIKENYYMKNHEEYEDCVIMSKEY